MSNKNILRNEILNELAFIKSVCSKAFLYPFNGREKKQMVGYYMICFLFLSLTTQLVITLMFAAGVDLLEIINVAPNLGVIIIAYMKYAKVHRYREFYNETLIHFQDDIWNIVALKSKEHQKIVKKYKLVMTYCNRFLVYYCTVLIVLVDSFPGLFMVYEQVYGATGEHIHPFDAWYPFDKVRWYIPTYIWESLMTALIVWLFSVIDSLNATCVGLICMELRILGNRVEEVLNPEDVVKISNGVNVEHIHQTVVRKLKIIIEKYNFLAKISSKLDGILGDIMLVKYSLGAIFICLTAYTSTVVDDRSKQTRYFLMCMSLCTEIFNQCLMGQILKNHSINFTEAIYFSDWTYASVEAKKIMLIFIMRTQTPFQLTGKGYIVMDMNCYTNICSTSYQFYNLLRTVYK